MSGNVSSGAGQALFVSGSVFCVKYIDRPALFFPGGPPTMAGCPPVWVGLVAWVVRVQAGGW